MTKQNKKITYKSTNVYAKEISNDIPLYDPKLSLKEQNLHWQDTLACECQTCKKHFAVDYYVYMQSRRLWAKRNQQDKSNYKYTCKTCRSKGKANSQWRDGKMIYQGYVYIHKSIVDKKYHYLAHGSYIAEHRLKIAMNLPKGKKLEPWQHIHHIDGVKDNNNLDNLEIQTNSEHCSTTHLVKYVSELEKEVLKLKDLLRTNNWSNNRIEQDYKNSENRCD